MFSDNIAYVFAKCKQKSTQIYECPPPRVDKTIHPKTINSYAHKHHSLCPNFCKK